MASSHSTKEIWKASEDAGAHLLVNMLMEFKDPLQQQSYTEFKAAQFGRKYFSFPLASIITIVYVVYWYLAISSITDPLGIASCAFTFTVTVPVLWALVTLKQNPSALPAGQHSRTYFVLENAFMVSNAMSVGLIVLLRTIHAACEHMTYLNIWACTPLFSCKRIPVETVLIMMFIPLLCCKTLPAISTKLALAVYLFCLGLAVTATIMVEAIFAVAWVVTAVTIVVVLHLISSRTQIQLFLFFQQTQELQRQRDEDVLRQAEEMRNQIGKIAHDLRTPLVAFKCGLEVMHKTINEIQSSPQKPDTSNKLRTHTQGLINALEGMEQSHLQLMMIIDRCMDYSKLTHGLALQPKTVPTHIGSVLETITGYFRKTQDSVTVVVDRADVLGYLLTDQAWLQDNLLCLVNNAVRFSPPQSTVFLRAFRCISAGSAFDEAQRVQDEAPDEEKGSAQGGTAMLRFEVEDFGPGLEEDKVDELFFAPDGSAARAEGGAGLGLFCMAERIKALRGEYGVRCKNVARSNGPSTDRATGVIFWFTIPADVVSSSVESDAVRRSGSSSRGSRDRDDARNCPAIEIHSIVSKSSFRSNRSSNWAGGSPSKDAKESDSRQVLPSVKENPAPSQAIIDNPSLDFSNHSQLAIKTSKSDSRDSFNALHLLIVDDSLLILKMLKMMFLGKGHAVMTTANGYEALTMLKACLDHHCSGSGISNDGNMMTTLPPGFSPQYPFDAVFVDIQMPIIDGLDTMREYHKMLRGYEANGGSGTVSAASSVRESERITSVPPYALPMSSPDLDGTTVDGMSPRAFSSLAKPMIIAMSANSDHVTMQDAYAAGADHFLPKPFDLDTFYTVLGKHRKKQQRMASLSSTGNPSHSRTPRETTAPKL